ncbi:MAG: heme-binding protein [Planctomycetales bacterium]
MFLMGGVPLKNGQTVVGGVGIAGSDSGIDDDTVAVKAAEKFAAMARTKSSN